MLQVNGLVVEYGYFPDNSIHLVPNFNVYKTNKITWKYEKEEELIVLIYLTNYLKEHKSKSIELYLPYIVNARMDRIKRYNDVFTLKYFSQIINSLEFKKVKVLDPHSSVSEALIKNIEQIDLWNIVYPFITSTRLTSEDNEIIIYFPDNGAAKKYEDMFIDRGYKTCYGIKHRDWDTGQITGLEVISNGLDLKGKTVLMFDDIISYGGSMYYAALELKELGVDKIFAYSSHTENSILNKEKGTLIKLLSDGTVERLFTTDSIFTGEHEKISVMEL